MISWIQNVLQKHNKILFSALLIVIIVAFVFTIGNFGGGPGGRARIEQVLFYGIDLNNPAQRDQLFRSAQLSMQLRRERAAVDPRRVERAAWQRAVHLWLADQCQIPEPNPDELFSFVETVPAFMDPQTGDFDRELLQQLRDRIQASSGSEQELERVLREDYRLARITEALTGPGYPQDTFAKLMIQRRETTYDLVLADMDFESFEPTIEDDDGAIAEYYEQRKERYATNPLVRVALIRFSESDFLEQVADPSDEAIRTYLENNPDTLSIEGGIPDTLTPAFKAIAVNAIKSEQAIELAIAAASDLSVEIYNAVYRNDLNANGLEAFLEKRGLTLEPVAEPVDRKSPQAQGNLTRAILQQAASLDAENFYSDPVELSDGAALFVFREAIEPTFPPLEEVIDRVEPDFREDRKLEAFNERGVELANQLREAVEAGSDFRALAEDAGLTVRTLEAVTIESEDLRTDFHLIDTIQSMSADTVSDMITSGNLGTIVYLESKSVPEIESDDEDLVSMREQVASQMKFLRSFSVVQELVNRGHDTIDNSL